MLNLADFSALLMILVGPLCGVGAAHAHKAGIVPLVLFGLVGLAVGFGVAMMSSKFAYAVLRSKKLSARAELVFYSLIPFAGLLAVALAPFVLAGIVYGWR